MNNLFKKLSLADLIGHELKNHLSLFRWHIETLKKSFSQKTLSHLSQETEKMIQFLNQIMHLQSLEHSTDLKKEWILINQLIEPVLNSLKPFAKNNNVSIKINPAGENIEVYTNIVFTKLALKNLILNAVEHTKDEVEITLKYFPKIRCLKIYFKDRGPGILKQELPHLFKAFYKGQNAKSQALGKNYGLGLTIAYKTALLQKGSLTVKNHPEGGALFILTLPQAQIQKLKKSA